MSSGPILSGLRPGFASALGAPALAMGATFLAFGAAVRPDRSSSGWSAGRQFWRMLSSTSSRRFTGML